MERTTASFQPCRHAFAQEAESSTHQKISGLIPGSSSSHANVSLGKTLSPELLPGHNLLIRGTDKRVGTHCGIPHHQCMNRTKDALCKRNTFTSHQDRKGTLNLNVFFYFKDFYNSFKPK